MNTESLSDKELVVRILSGHPDLFGPLVERHIRAAHAVAYARLGNTADAEDAVQEGFLRAYKRLASLRDPARFAAWLLAITRHEAARVAAKRNKTPLVPGMSNLPDSSSESETAMVQPDPAQREMNQLLRDHVMCLQESAREVLLLHYFAGHSAREIAGLLDLRRAAVLKRLQRAREALAETLLRDLETVKPAPETLTKHAVRITALASALTIEKALTGGVAAAATTGFGLAGVASLFPRAGTIAAAVAGMVFTAGLGWVYLNKQATEAVDAASDAPSPVSVLQSALPEPEESPAEGTPPPLPETPAAPVLLAQADATPPNPPSAPAPHYPNATGTWDVNVLMAGTHEEHLGMATITDLGGVLRIVPEDVELAKFYYDCQRVGGTITLRMDDPDARGTLTGSFDTGFTTLTMNGTIATGSDGNGNPIDMEIQMVAKRLDPNAPSRDELVTLLREQMRALHPKLQQYVAVNGEYPASLNDLSPDYIHDTEEYRSTATRTYAYARPAHFDEVAIEQLTSAVTSATSAAELAAIEEQLLDLWGDRFLRIPAVLDVRDADLNVHLVLGLNGFVTEITDFHAIPEDASPAVKNTRARAQNAACMNNMKQLGLVMKMFEHEQAANLWPAGWRMTFPEYMTDVTILTCPGHEPGTESYDLLFPGVTADWLMALARTLEGLPEDTPHATLQSFVPVLVETDRCNGLDGRNVLYLDGHVSLINDAEWSAQIAPYLQYR